jgi:ethanolamine transporter EutH
MNRSRLVTIGLGVMIAGLVALAVGAIVASHDLLVGLILLLVVPLSISFCGAIVTLIGLARQPEPRRRSTHVRKIIGVVALAGVAIGFGYPALATLSQLPDYAAGLNDTFLPPTALSTAVSLLLFPGMGLVAGGSVGILVALIWWTTEGRHLPPAGAASSPGSVAP